MALIAERAPDDVVWESTDDHGGDLKRILDGRLHEAFETAPLDASMEFWAQHLGTIGLSGNTFILEILDPNLAFEKERYSDSLFVVSNSAVRTLRREDSGKWTVAADEPLPNHLADRSSGDSDVMDRFLLELLNFQE